MPQLGTRSRKKFVGYNKHITLRQKASSHAFGLINSVQILSKYRETYQNYLSVLEHIIQKKYPAKAFLRNGQEVGLTSFEQSYNLARLQNQKQVLYDFTSNTVVISRTGFTNSRDLRLKGALDNGEIVNIFIEERYRNFPVEGKIVLDVGANIADSCIYFASRGAEKVIGVEPLLKNYEIAEENIKLNNYSNNITLVLAGCSAKEGSINSTVDWQKGIGKQIYDDSKEGTTIPLLTLEQILEQNNVGQRKTVLKMDCEGCEYDVILSASDSVLRRFSNILIEYHYGFNDIKERLEKCNFDVSLIKISGEPGGATALPDPERLGHWYYMGYIQATLSNDVNK